MKTALLVAGGYVLGSMPWGYWLPRLVKRDDIRRHGSGNIGGTNVWRVYGWRLGLPVVLLDTAKGFVRAGKVGLACAGNSSRVAARFPSWWRRSPFAG